MRGTDGVLSLGLVSPVAELRPFWVVYPIPWSCAVSCQADPKELNWILKEDPLQNSRVLSLCSSPPLPPSPVDSSHLGFSSFLYSRTQPDSIQFPLLVQWPGNSLSAISWSNFRAHLICFSSFKDHGPSLSDVQYLESYCFIYFVWFFSCSR